MTEDGKKLGASEARWRFRTYSPVSHYSDDEKAERLEDRFEMRELGDEIKGHKLRREDELQRLHLAVEAGLAAQHQRARADTSAREVRIAVHRGDSAWGSGVDLRERFFGKRMQRNPEHEALRRVAEERVMERERENKGLTGKEKGKGKKDFSGFGKS